MIGLDTAADVAMEKVVGLKQGEEILIVTNPQEEVLSIAMSLFGAAKRLGGRPVITIQDDNARDRR